jgi:hypothetical protein
MRLRAVARGNQHIALNGGCASRMKRANTSGFQWPSGRVNSQIGFAGWPERWRRSHASLERTHSYRQRVAERLLRLRTLQVTLQAIEGRGRELAIQRQHDWMFSLLQSSRPVENTVIGSSTHRAATISYGPRRAPAARGIVGESGDYIRPAPEALSLKPTDHLILISTPWPWAYTAATGAVCPDPAIARV